ncbi:MAG: ankyrin repeat domain-containing protein [Bacteroidales bacterium]
MNSGNLTIILLSFFLLACEQIFSQDNTLLILRDTTFVIVDPEYELLMAATEGDTLKIAALLEYGIDVNTSTYDGISPLMYAAHNGHLRTVELLIDSGARVNQLPDNKVSALLGACYSEHVFVADTLIQNGADINTSNRNGTTPLMVSAALGNFTLTDMLIFYGANINKRDNKGNSALMMATVFNHFEVVNLLLNNEADINQSDVHGNSPLMVAAQNGYYDLANFLIMGGAAIDMANENNLTALSLAILGGHKDLCYVLFENGANINYEISKSRNQLSLAREFNQMEIADFLKEQGGIENRKPNFEKLGIGILSNFNANDFMLGGSVSLYESKYDFELKLKYMTRPAVRSVFYESLPKIHYQFWERRSVMQLGINKNLRLMRKSISKHGGIFLGINVGYTYGNYRGSSKKPDDTFNIVPNAGLYYNLKNSYFKFNYEYMKFKNSGVSPHRFEIAIGVLVNLNKYKIETKPDPVL